MIILPQNNKIKFIAHRGLSAEAPENTLPAYKKAVNKGFQFVECDITLTADRQWILLHDETVNRTTDGRGKVNQFTLSKIKNLDAGKWKDEKYIETRIPTLKEFLLFCKQKNISPYIEIKEKYSNIKTEDLLNIINICRKISIKKEVSIISFDFAILKKIRNLDQQIRLGFLCHLRKKHIAKVHTINNIFLNVHYRSTNLSLLNNAYSRGLNVECWTVNHISILKKIINRGITGITTDTEKILNYNHQILGH